ncbi:U2 snRNP component prp10 [Coemansia spiralis]|uniref:U2 snRNP component prp10 n=2 Tax=Coemansia TaxID=4863 RepID=A0A9W8G6Y4_9FUNG|nr:U2 snRNP component prp10 [Coemansia umbellata]KAJ2620792.1 U2 snRNP component prp10 [Coemansia sp. RSA 1358]KAJ2674619.1 U2 snRNP component prp10 [Coemansia spiralis]
MSSDLKEQLEVERRNRKKLEEQAAAASATTTKNNARSQKATTRARGFVDEIKFDTDLYGAGDKYAGFDTSIGVSEEQQNPPQQQYDDFAPQKSRFGITAPRELLEELQDAAEEHSEDPLKAIQRARGTNRVIADRESDYQKRRHGRQLSPERTDAFGASNATEGGLNYSEAMRRVQLENEKADLMAKIKKAQEEKKESQEYQQTEEDSSARPRRMWDVETPTHPASTSSDTKRRNRWDQTPADIHTTAIAETPRRSRWDETPKVIDGSANSIFGETPRRTRSRWDETPLIIGNGTGSAVGFGATPAGAYGLETPSVVQIAAAGSAFSSKQQESQQQPSAMDARNMYQTDEELDALLPSEGYIIMDPPPSYVPIRTPSRKLMATPAPLQGSEGFHIGEETKHPEIELPSEIPGIGALPFFKQDDMQFFGKLLDGQNEDDMDISEKRERQVLRLLLKIKNGTPPMRKIAMRQIADKAREFGAAPIFNQVLPLLMAPSLEEQERHLLVKVIDRAMFRLGDLVRPFVHKILVVIEPMLIDEDRYARAEGCEIISNLSKAAGLPAMIATMRPDIDHADEYVRNTTARALSVVASALGIPALLPFLKAVCKSKKSWQARQTGIRIVRQTAILMQSGILPHLNSLVECIGHGLEDEHQAVRTTTALALSALAEAAAPYGIESFDSILKPLWLGIRKHRGKSLAAFLKAVGFIIPLMDVEHANHYTREVMLILIREFQSPDEYMKNIVLKVVKQCVTTPGVPAQYIKDEVLPEYFRNFWVRRMALERRQYYQVIDTTVELAEKVGGAEIITRIVLHLKDESGPYRNMVMEAISRIITNLGAMDIEGRLEELLMDGVLYAFQEQAGEGKVMLDGFGIVVNGLGTRAKPYLQQITSALLWRLNNQNPQIRQQAADLVARIAPVMKTCGEDELMSRISIMLYEYLGEEYPEVLGSILGGLKSIVNVIGMSDMQPPIGDLLPRLTPILKNRHEKVQENCIDLVGRIADRGAEYVSAREWMRNCFSLVDLLRAHKKSIRRAAVNTFGYIAKAIGPQDVLATLLNNLKVQERQTRVCTTVAIAIVAETCAPFTVLPALMNEYRVPELNVQNGVLKSISFLFEYIGDMGKDYVNAVTSLLEDALLDRDLVHRQQAASVIKHMALGVAGLNNEDPVLHLLNYLWPNIFETSPHSICAVLEAIESCRVCLGPGRVLQYTLQGMFHPARKVREVYWRIYNMMYVASQPALVAFYPRIENENKNTYRRYELDYTI